MKAKKISDLIEKLAPLESQEEWDCSGEIISSSKDIKKILLCLSVTKNIVEQAIDKNCDMIISHHPLFFVPFEFNQGVEIYCAHTNLDKAKGGTTDTLIETLGFCEAQKIANFESGADFLRLVQLKEEISLDSFIEIVKQKLELNVVRVVNNLDKRRVGKIAFCAGSGADFLTDVQINGADAFVTGDVKYHSALESDVIIIDVGHFESEIPVLEKLKKLLEETNLEVVIADEKSPFINY